MGGKLPLVATFKRRDKIIYRTFTVFTIGKLVYSLPYVSEFNTI